VSAFPLLGVSQEGSSECFYYTEVIQYNHERRQEVQCLSDQGADQNVIPVDRASEVPKKVAFSKKSACRAGAVRSDASASKPAEKVSAISAQKPVCSSSVKQDPPTITAATV
jgi:hypothetical protein